MDDDTFAAGLPDDDEEARRILRENPDRRYPDIPDDADGFDALLRQLSEVDEPHYEKALALVLMAQTEWRYANSYDDRFCGGSFIEFARAVIEEGENVIETQSNGV